MRIGEGVMMTKTTDESTFFGSKMVDKVMSARKGGNGDVARKTAERVGRAAGRSLVDMAVKPTMVRCLTFLVIRLIK